MLSSAIPLISLARLAPLAAHPALAAPLLTVSLAATSMLPLPTTSGPTRLLATPSVPMASSSRPLSIVSVPTAHPAASPVSAELTTALRLVDAGQAVSSATPVSVVSLFVPMASMAMRLPSSANCVLLDVNSVSDLY